MKDHKIKNHYKEVKPLDGEPTPLDVDPPAPGDDDGGSGPGPIPPTTPPVPPVK